MRNNATTGIPLSVSVSVCALMVLLCVTGTANAKRGCSAFGHSCFGGHGKRFDPHIRDNVLEENEAVTSERNQEMEALRVSNKFADPEQKFDSQGEILLPVLRRQDFSRVDPYTFSFIVRQWVQLGIIVLKGNKHE